MITNNYYNEVDLSFLALIIEDNEAIHTTKIKVEHLNDVLCKIVFSIAVRCMAEKNIFLPLVDLKALFEDKDRMLRYANYAHPIKLMDDDSNPMNVEYLLGEILKFKPTHKIKSIEKVIIDRYTKERLFIINNALSNDLSDSSKTVSEILRKYSSNFDRLLSNNSSTRQTLTSHDAVKIEQAFLNSPKAESFPRTGLVIDELNGGLNAPSLTVLLGAPKSGKAQPLYSKILTPTGFTTFADIKVGDRIMSPSGKVERVVAIPYEGEQPVYRITFLDGGFADFGENHLMNIMTAYSKKEKTMTVKEIINKPIKSSGKYQLKVRVTEPIEFENNSDKLPIDPYLLGVLLGDGYLANDDIAITNGEEDIVQSILKIIGEGNYNCVYHNSKNSYTIRILRSTDFGKKLVESLKSLGLMDKKSKSKFIPEMYKKAAASDRKMLLCGLFDTDGCIESTSKIYYTSSNNLKDDVIEIANSLGYIASSTDKKASIKGKDYGICHRVNITTYDEIFTSKKHKEKHRPRQKNILRRISNIEYLGLMQTKCITTSDPEGLYLTDNFIVTHNSTFLYNAAITSLYQGRTILFATIEIPVEECFRKIMSIYSGVEYNLINKKELNEEQQKEYMAAVQRFSEEFKDKLFIIDDQDGISSKDISLYIDQLEKAGIKVDDVFVDYILIMKGNNVNAKTKIEELLEIPKELRQLSQTHKVRVFSANQLHSKTDDKDISEINFDDVYYTKNLSQEATYTIAIKNTKVGKTSILQTKCLPSRQLWTDDIYTYPNFEQSTLTLNECVLDNTSVNSLVSKFKDTKADEDEFIPYIENVDI